jgi:hypothetical protein
MADPAKPSTAVTAAAIIAIIGSVFAVLGALMSVFGLFFLAHLPQGPAMPAGVLPLVAATMICVLAVAVLGIFTGIGLLRLKNWARISALVWAGISAPFSALIMLVFLLIPTPAPPHGPAAPMYFVRVFSLVFYGVPLAIGLWWLVLFNSKAVVAQFASPAGGSETPSSDSLLDSPAPRPPAVPLAITVLAWFFLLSSCYSCPCIRLQSCSAWSSVAPPAWAYI